MSSRIDNIPTSLSTGALTVFAHRRCLARRVTCVIATFAAANPVYVPRNHLVDEALTAAVAGDLRPVEDLVDLLRTPYVERDTALGHRLATPPAPAAFVTFCGT